MQEYTDCIIPVRGGSGRRELSRKRKLLVGVLVILLFAIVFVYAQLDIAYKSIQFDLRKIGESVYDARSKNGKWPARIDDLDGTEYLKLPHRRTMLEEGQFVIVWNQDLGPNPDDNPGRVLAYDHGSLLARFGRVWVCRGDLRIESMDADQLRVLLNRARN